MKKLPATTTFNNFLPKVLTNFMKEEIKCVFCEKKIERSLMFLHTPIHINWFGGSAIKIPKI